MIRRLKAIDRPDEPLVQEGDMVSGLEVWRLYRSRMRGCQYVCIVSQTGPMCTSAPTIEWYEVELEPLTSTVEEELCH